MTRKPKLVITYTAKHMRAVNLHTGETTAGWVAQVMVIQPNGNAERRHFGAPEDGAAGMRTAMIRAEENARAVALMFRPTLNNISVRGRWPAKMA